jgi:pimeloyl-ACP methyl ester carboxylesterase
LKSAKPFQIQVHGKTIQCWKWGDGPVILFVHGWNGIGIQFYNFFEPLLKAGNAVVTFDAPAHGVSQGKVTNYFEYSDTVRTILKNSHCQNIRGVIAHSFGASAVINSMSKERLNIDIIAVAPALKLREIIFKAFNQHGIPSKIYLHLISELENVYGYRFDRDNPHLLLNKLKAPILIIHDQDDLLVPYRDSEEMAKKLPHIHLYSTRGLGHKRILNDQTVINEALRQFGAIKRHKNRAPKNVDKYFASAGLPE